jgi:hypothetical protein
MPPQFYTFIDPTCCMFLFRFLNSMLFMFNAHQLSEVLQFSLHDYGKLLKIHWFIGFSEIICYHFSPLQMLNINSAFSTISCSRLVLTHK